MKKSSNWLQKKVLFSLLTAAAVGMSASAFATEYNDKISAPFTCNDDEFKLITTDVRYGMDAYSGKDITVTSKTIEISAKGTGDWQVVGADSWSNATLTLGGENTESVNVKVENTNITSTNKWVYGIVALGTKDENAASTIVDVTTKKLDVEAIGPDGSEYAAALFVGNNTQKEIAPANAATLTVKAEEIYLKSTAIGIGAFSNGQVKIDGNIKIEAPHVIDARGNSTVNINTDGKHTTVLNGDIVFETTNTSSDSHGSGNVVNANVNLNLAGEGSSWTGTAYQQFGGEDHVDVPVTDTYYGDITGLSVGLTDGATWNMTGNSFANNITATDGAAINVSDKVTTLNIATAELDNAALNVEGNANVAVKGELKADNAALNLNGSNSSVSVGKLDGSSLAVTTNSLNNKVSITTADENTSVAVTGGSKITDSIASGEASLQDLANTVTTKEGDKDKSVADSITTEANDINGGYSANLDSDGNVVAGSVKTYENDTNRAVSDMASLSLMTWRQENNDMNKRLGELRDSKGQHGAWVRMARGESKYGSKGIKNQYNYYQVGYDEKLSNSPNWTVGVALTRTEGDSTFKTGSGENKHTGVALYGSYLADNGSFIDLVAKYARMDNDYKTIGAGVGDADYETNGYSLSAEYGKRFTQDSGLWIEPQVELTYGKVSSADYITSKGARVRQEGMDSLVARLGFSLGQNFKQGNAYVRASYLYDFDGETDVTMSKTGAGSYKYGQDLGGGWWEIGVGTNINLSDATHLYFDVEKTYGGNVATPWQWNAGIRYSF